MRLHEEHQRSGGPSTFAKMKGEINDTQSTLSDPLARCPCNDSFSSGLQKQGQFSS